MPPQAASPKGVPGGNGRVWAWKGPPRLLAHGGVLVILAGEKYPKAAMGQQARKGPFRAKRARFPLVPPSEMRLAAVGFKQPPYLKVVACRFSALRAVSLLPGQRYLPRLVSSFNSMTFLNAAQSLCAVFQALLTPARRYGCAAPCRPPDAPAFRPHSR